VRERGHSRNVSERIAGAFPDERSERGGGPNRGARPQWREGRPGQSGRPGRSGGQPGFGPRPRPAAAGARTDVARFDRRRASTPSSARPRIPDSITEDQLSREVKAELHGLPADLAVSVGRYLVAAELASDPEQGYRYAQAARELATRIGVVREVSGIMAYRTGRWAEALSELRAARRMTGRGEYLPLMADSERALGRLDRALELVHSDDAKRLPRASQIELRIVESGIRRDQGLADAAVLALEVPELSDGRLRPWSARLFYAYGEALLAADRPEAAREAFSRAVMADEDQETDALARLDELDGISVEDLEDSDDWDEEGTDDEDEFAGESEYDEFDEDEADDEEAGEEEDLADEAEDDLER
jgi:tetratricopeptide (TPR) repeat protein